MTCGRTALGSELFISHPVLGMVGPGLAKQGDKHHLFKGMCAFLVRLGLPLTFSKGAWNLGRNCSLLSSTHSACRWGSPFLPPLSYNTSNINDHGVSTGYMCAHSLEVVVVMMMTASLRQNLM